MNNNDFIENILLHAENRSDIFNIALRFGFVEINNNHPDFIINGVPYKRTLQTSQRKAVKIN